KIAVFFLTFLPQFVNPESHTFMPFLILGITYIVLTIVWYLFYIYLLNQISSFM
ncbi:LysE family translocator, partial [Priestia megaterium]